MTTPSYPPPCSKPDHAFEIIRRCKTCGFIDSRGTGHAHLDEVIDTLSVMGRRRDVKTIELSFHAENTPVKLKPKDGWERFKPGPLTLVNIAIRLLHPVDKRKRAV